MIFEALCANKGLQDIIEFLRYPKSFFCDFSGAEDKCGLTANYRAIRSLTSNNV